MRPVLRRLTLGLLGLLTALGLVIGYGVLIEPRLVLDEEHLEVALPELPAGEPAWTLAVFSDPQVGARWANTGMVRRVVETVIEEKPRAVLLGGDFVYGHTPDPARQVDHVVELLTPVAAAGIPTFAVLGNHDYAAGAAERVTSALENLGIRVLHNDAVPVPGTGAGAGALHIVGLGPAHPDLADATAALDQVPASAPRVVLMHNPTSFPALPPGQAPFAIAGHTHCGQIAIPGLPHWSWAKLTGPKRSGIDGWAPAGFGAAGNRLYITCGIGFSYLPIRIGAPPQVVFVDLAPPP